MLQIGRKNTLEVYKFVDFGLYLDGEQYGPILLPKRYVPENVEEGDEIEVFIYLDSEDRLVATTETPNVQVGECAYLQAKDSNDFGVFMDWGLQKDLFVPFRQQKEAMTIGNFYWIYCFLDEKTDRIAASAKIDKYLLEVNPEFAEGAEVSIQIHSKTALGYKAIIENNCWGLLFANEIFEPLAVGDRRTAYIKTVREDGKIDLSLQRIGIVRFDDVQQKILDALRAQGGFLPLHDKSDAAEIQTQLGMSKKNFKAAIGMLFKAKVIAIQENGVKLL
ncbi:MAG: GntR family transcriptional regulator [Bacteroidales bacterium]|nr:GntR family transcriptional regulator [Bacteroidales bacterium]